MTTRIPLTVVLVMLSVVGCASAARIDDAIARYNLVAGQVKLGDSKDKVLPILMPTQSELELNERKPPDTFLADDKSLYEVYFFRSRRIPDSLITDDEFTPYVFKDGVLVAVGWTVLGGPKTQGRAMQPSGSVEASTGQRLRCFQDGPFINCR